MSDLFSGLDPSVPATLLPIRLEARFDGSRLRLRMIPDAIHAYSHVEALLPAELEAGRAYWSALWASEDADTAMRTVERNTLAALVGTHRAVHVAKATRPRNWEDWDAEPLFPAVETLDAPRPPVATLLPDFWVVRLFDDRMSLIRSDRCKNDIAADLAMAPVLGALEEEAREALDGGDALDTFLADQNLRWLVDFKRALDVGMAYETRFDRAQPRLGAILVAGVRRDGRALEQAAELERTLRGHWFGEGLDVLPQGTATNHSDESTPPPTADAEDVDRLFELDETGRPLAVAARAAALRRAPESLMILPAADQLSLAFGTIFGNRLDHVAHADLNQGLEASTLATIASEGFGRYYATRVATHQGGQAPFAAHWQSVGAHHRRWVRAAGPLPSLRVGGQPYGILPVQGRLGPERATDPGDAELIDTILALFPRWLGGEPPATLDPDATDGRPAQTPQATIAVLLEVLGHVPHLRNLVVRTLHNDVQEDAEAIARAFDDLEALFSRPGVSTGFGWEALLASLRARMTGIGNPTVPDPVAPSLAAQFALLTELEIFIRGDPTAPLLGGYIDADHVNEALGHAKTIETILNFYQEGLDSLPVLIRPFFGQGGVSLAPPAVVKPDGLANFAASVYEAEADALGALVAPGGDLGPLGGVLETISVKSAVPETPPRTAAAGPGDPLLAHLVDLAWRFVPSDEIGGLRGAVELLAARVSGLAALEPEDAQRKDGIADLERLTREALGPLSYRIDAWVTSFAARRLALMRAEAPHGTTLGGYGWLLDLAPGEGHRSDGYILAPSTNQAVTAALLHSGWKAYGTADGTAPLAVDLTSDRVRGAEWILDGVRNGHDLSDILGARLERSLHDDPMGLDSYIDDIRAAANADKGLARPAARIADGLRVARAFSAEPDAAEQELRDALDGLTTPANSATAGNRRNKRVRELFRQLAGELDAVADLTMAQSVHSLATGNDAAAGAVLNMLGDQEGPVPTIDVVHTPRHGQLVTHRIGVICPEDDGEIGGAGPILAVAEPRLAAWLAARLPDPGDVGVSVRLTGAGGAAMTRRHALTELGLGAAELVPLAGRQETQASSTLGRLVLAWAKRLYPDRDVALLPGDRARRALSLDEFGIVAAAAADAVAAARTLQPKDFMPPDSEAAPAELDTAALKSRRLGLREMLKTYLGELKTAAGPIELWPLARDLVALRVAPALALAEMPDDRSRLEPVLDALGTRVAAMDAAESDEEALQAGAGGAIRILPPVVLASDAAARPEPGANQLDDLEQDGGIWWTQLAAVSPKVQAMALFLDLSRALGGPRERPALRQMPARAEGWAAVRRPSDTEDRTCLYFATGAADLAAGGSVAGLVCDTLVDTIPATTQPVGLAWHFDAPSARPPRAVLLSMLDEAGDPFDDQIFAQLLNTLELAKVRSRGADRVPGLGQIAPALFFPDPPNLAEP